MGRPLREYTTFRYLQTFGTYTIIYTRVGRSLWGAHCPVVSPVVWSGSTLVSSSLVNGVDTGERPLPSSVSFFWRLKRPVVSADHCETPALPLALTRTNNRHTRYPSTILVEIQADKAVRRTTSMLKIVPERATLR